MRDLPFIARCIINIILFILYWAIVSILVGIAMFFVLGQVVNNDLADKIAMFAGILLLLISLIWRKYFYLCGRESEKMIVLEEQVVSRKPRVKDLEDEEFKIFVDREIK